ncbi:MAG TPA: CAP domain-containing protein, partial [Sulfitobacter sp.]|nr:CAP domain-containing protein [Sulfitobacter sp.]
MNILRRLALAVALLIAAILPLRADPQAVQM